MSNPGSANFFGCPSCGKRYRWKSQLAGQRVKCVCGQVMTCPVDVNGAPDEMYDIAPAVAAPVQPASPVASAPAPSTSTQVPLQYQRPAVAEKPDERFPDKTIDLYLPVILIAAATLIEVIAALIRGGRAPGRMQRELIDVSLHLVVGTATMLVGVLIAARARGIDLGYFWTAVLKLAAISIAPGAIVTVASPALRFIPFGFLLGWLGHFVLYFAFIGAMFKLDEEDTWYCVCVIFIVDVAFYLTLLWWAYR